VRDIHPWKPAATLGAQLRWRHGRLAVTGDPYLLIGLANTDQGNRAALYLPLELAVQPARRVALVLDTGWNTELAVWRDGWHVPIGIGAVVRAMEQLDIGATLGFPELLGPQNTPKDRVVFVTLAWRAP